MFQPRISPSHIGRQILGLALQAPESIQHPPSEGSRLHGLFDEDSCLTKRQELHRVVSGYILKELFAPMPMPMHLTGRACSMPAMCCLVANRCHSVGRPIVES